MLVALGGKLSFIFALMGGVNPAYHTTMDIVTCFYLQKTSLVSGLARGDVENKGVNCHKHSNQLTTKFILFTHHVSTLNRNSLMYNYNNITRHGFDI